jgi:hypothetical protein
MFPDHRGILSPIGHFGAGSARGELRTSRPTTYVLPTRDLDVIDAELRLIAALRRTARERASPLPSMPIADALLGRIEASSPSAFAAAMTTRARVATRQPIGDGRSGASYYGNSEPTYPPPWPLRRFLYVWEPVSRLPTTGLTTMPQLCRGGAGMQPRNF